VGECVVSDKRRSVKSFYLKGHCGLSRDRVIAEHHLKESDGMSLGVVMGAAPVRRGVHMLTYIVTA